MAKISLSTVFISPLKKSHLKNYFAIFFGIIIMLIKSTTTFFLFNIPYFMGYFLLKLFLRIRIAM